MILSVQGPAQAGLPWEKLDLPADLFPHSSEYHQIQSFKQDPAAPGFLVFSVSGGQEKSEVEGLADLRKWILETMVIGKLDKEQNAGEGVSEGAVESLKGTGRGLKNMVFHPIASAKGLGKATGELGDKIGDSFRKKEPGEKGDGFLDSSKRQIAKKLGVDVYSRNPKLQGKLSSLAKQQMGGRGVVMVATFLIPFGLVASAVMTASSVNDAADELVNDKDRSDLYALNKDALLALGFTETRVKAFLNHSYYTPRELTYIRFYLEKLRPLQGFKSLFEKAVLLTDPVPAQKFLHEMQISVEVMETSENAQAVRIVPHGLLLECKDAVILATGYDLIEVSPLGDQVAKEVLDAKAQLGKKSAGIWSAGVVTSEFGGSLVSKAVEIRRMCLFKLSADRKTPV